MTNVLKKNQIRKKIKKILKINVGKYKFFKTKISIIILEKYFKYIKKKKFIQLNKLQKKNRF